MIPACSHRGSHPTLNDSHNQAKHIKGDWQRLYASCCYHHTCGTIVGLDLESQLKSWITAGCQMIPSCSDWDSHPTLNGSQIHSKHINNACQTLYTMQWMQIWSPHHAITATFVGPDLESQLKSWMTLGVKWYHHAVAEALNPTWNDSHIHSKHIKDDWQAFMAVDGDVEPPSCSYQHTCGTGLRKSAENYWSLLVAKWYHHAVVETLIPHWMIPSSSPNI